MRATAVPDPTRLMRQYPATAMVLDHQARDFLTSARDQFLAALPVAAAIVEHRGGAPTVARSNAAFDRMIADRADAFTTADRLVSERSVAAHIVAFIESDDADIEFDWIDGDDIGGRLFQVRCGRLQQIADARRCLVSLVDRTGERAIARSLRTEMLHDSLTGLPNRIAFDEACEAAIVAAQAGGERPAVLILDLTRFGRINDSLGTLAGDELIITVARRLLGAVRAGDLLARKGGDEFGVLLRRGAGEAETLAAARRLQAALGAPFRLSDLDVRVDGAVGCATWTPSTPTVEDLVRNAQVALKRAKLSGEAELFQAGETSDARRLLTLETELRRALDNGDLTLAYQPLIDLQNGRLAGFEALARWTHPTRGPIPPNEFIPVAEEAGLIVPLGRWAMETALATLAGWDRAAGRALPVHVAVNVSAIQLVRDDVAALVERALTAHGLAGDRLTLEITESAIIRDPERATRVLQALKGLDARIAMDDFGTGYSSLAYLQKLPIDLLKIDRSFVTPMLRDRDSVAIVRAVLGLADALGMKTVAEGVETIELAQTLSALGCGYAQGYHYARPLAVEAAWGFVQQSSP